MDGLQALNPLMSAARAGHYDIVQKLIAAGADVNHRSRDPNVPSTALMAAAEGGSVAVAELLLEAGASVNETSHGVGVRAARAPVFRWQQ